MAPQPFQHQQSDGQCLNPRAGRTGTAGENYKEIMKELPLLCASAKILAA